MSINTLAAAHPIAVCLGSGVNADGTASETTFLRVSLTLELARADPQLTIILSGDGRKEKDPDRRARCKTEAAVMAEYLTANGIASDRLRIEDESVDTIGNAVLSTVRYLSQETPARLQIISSPFHEKRAMLSFAGTLGPGWDLVYVPCAVASDDAVRGANEQGGIAWTDNFFQGISAGDLPAVVARLLEKGKTHYAGLERLRTFSKPVATPTKS
ncbi:MAG: YdcF family protein [Cyanobacteria bacterium REEB67]|nr:YdcF family protein [Cyanobacteria bacterium REEB67]